MIKSSNSQKKCDKQDIFPENLLIKNSEGS